MMFSLIQIVLLICAVLAIGKAVVQYRRGAIVLGQLVLWMVLWCGIGVVVVRPEITSSLASILGVGRGSDLAVYAAVCTLLFVVAWLVVKHEEQEHQLTKLVRGVALSEHRSRKKKPSGS